MARNTEWMWSEAMDMLARAERLHRQMFQPGPARPPDACWEPPVDIFETPREVLVLAALPGVDPDQVQTLIEDGVLVIAARRVLPPELKAAAIHRMELPQGLFERRVRLPPGRYGAVSRAAAHGLIAVRLEKRPEIAS